MSKILTDFGNNIRKLRTDQHISQEELAFRSGLHRTYIGMIERGEKNVSLINIEKLSRGLNVEIKDLFIL